MELLNPKKLRARAFFQNNDASFFLSTARHERSDLRAQPKIMFIWKMVRVLSLPCHMASSAPNAQLNPICRSNSAGDETRNSSKQYSLKKVCKRALSMRETGPPSSATLHLARPPAPHPAGLQLNFEPPQMRALYIVEGILWVRGPPECSFPELFCGHG